MLRSIRPKRASRPFAASVDPTTRATLNMRLATSRQLAATRAERAVEKEARANPLPATVIRAEGPV
jgi:hypothetical protein